MVHEDESKWIDETKTPTLLMALTPGTQGYVQKEKVMMRLLQLYTENMTQSLDNLNKSINSHSQISQKLSTKLFWLNIILATITILGTVAGIMTLWIDFAALPIK